MIRRRALLFPLLAVVAFAAIVVASPVSGKTTASTAVRGGTLNIVNGDDVDFLDTADAYSPTAWALERAYARTLYAYKSSKDRRTAATAVPDLAAAPPKISNGGQTYTFTLRQGVKWGPPGQSHAHRAGLRLRADAPVRQEDAVEWSAVRAAHPGRGGVREGQGQEDLGHQGARRPHAPDHPRRSPPATSCRFSAWASSRPSRRRRRPSTPSARRIRSTSSRSARTCSTRTSPGS